MTFRFDQGEVVQFNNEKFGKGTGVVVGYYTEADVYIVYPKVEHEYEDYSFMCLPIKAKDLISTPF